MERLKYTLLAVLLLLEFIFCLRLLELRVPTHVPIGTRAILSCRWQLGPGDVLYAVKWYKDGREFFRHVPKDQESWRKYSLPGVDVEESDSTGSNITLAPASLGTKGRYRCEVSGEKPLFPTVSDHADLIVIGCDNDDVTVLPEHGPMIFGWRPRYKVGDLVSVNCSSGRSLPETKLSWFINGEPAPSHTVTAHHHQSDANGLVAASLKLEFILTQHYFRRGGLKLKCLATIGTIYWRSNEESAQNERIKSFGDAGRAAQGGESNLVQFSSSEKCGKTSWFILGHIIAINVFVRLNNK